MNNEPTELQKAIETRLGHVSTCQCIQCQLIDAAKQLEHQKIISADFQERYGNEFASRKASEKEHDQLRTELKMHYVAGDRALQALRDLVSYEHSRNNISVVGRVAI